MTSEGDADQTDGKSQCDANDCENDAVAVYEGYDPSYGTIRYQSCNDCAPDAPPLRWVDEQLVTDGGQPAESTDGGKHCLDLFAGLGGFSAAFEDADDWTVTTVEIREGLGPDLTADVLELTPADLLDAVGTDREDMGAFVVLASPPCTYFSTAGNHDAWNFDAKRPTSEDAREAVTLVYHTLGLIRALSPDYWFLENPQGRLRWTLGEPAGKVTYCQYGRPYMKRTDLWGDHPPMTYRACSRGESCHEANREYDGTSAVRVLGETPEERAKEPRELSESILYAVKDALAGRAPEQTTLTGVTEA